MYIKKKKYSFYKKINEDILQDNNISWKEFKRLRESTKEDPVLDIFDIGNFYNFFQALYKPKVLENSDLYERFERVTKPTPDTLNRDITLEELKRGIKSLQNGKAAGLDDILNEFLKNSSEKIQLLLLKLFNECLQHGVYPWNTTVITPLHKKGCPHDRDNYRAIAVGSNIGKLFSNILLDRLPDYRAQHSPETTNQRGFCKGAQTADNLFTLNTCIEKYVKVQRKRLYTCFDFRGFPESI